MSELTPSLCNCGHHKDRHTLDITLCAELGQPRFTDGCEICNTVDSENWCISFSPPPSPPDDLEGAARERAWNAFENEHPEADHACDKCESQYSIFLTGYDAGRERIPDAVPKWVRIETDGLPRQFGSYLVYCSNGKARVCGYFGNKEHPEPEFHFPYSEHSHKDVIAWMPLPEPYVQQEARKDD
jgi:hypothetical protein